jgi:transposase
VVVQQAERIEQLEVEVAELRRQLGQNSRNSSKPPSSDSPFTKPAPRSLRRKSGRKLGGQPGHPGSTLALVTNPDQRRRHEPGPCTGCGADLRDAPEIGVERRQVFDLPPMMVRATEQPAHRAPLCLWDHHLRHRAAGRERAGAVWAAITAIILYLYVGQFLSKKRTAAALAELFATPVSEGTVATVAKRAAY